MRSKLSRNAGKFIGAMKEWPYSKCQDNGFRLHSFAIVKGKIKNPSVMGKLSHLTCIESGRNLLLEPITVRNKVFDG